VDHIEPVDLAWDDDGTIPNEITPDDSYLLTHMTDETLGAVEAGPGETILDVGCGRGLDLLTLRHKGATLFGFDGSLVMLKIAGDNFREQSVVPRLLAGSAENLPYADMSFDKVICKGAIDHFYDPGQALAEMVRVLKPGGRLVVAVANFNSLGFRLARFRQRIRQRILKDWKNERCVWDKPDDHVYEFNHSFLRRLLPSGVEIEKDFGISMFWGYPKWGKFLQALPRPLADFIIRVLDRIAHVRPALGDVLVVRARRPIESGDSSFYNKGKYSKKLLTNGEPTLNKYSRIQGLTLCLGTFFAALLFLIGVFAKNWWALAIPVAIGFLWLLGLGFWIGWTLLTIQVEPQTSLKED